MGDMFISFVQKAGAGAQQNPWNGFCGGAAGVEEPKFFRLLSPRVPTAGSNRIKKNPRPKPRVSFALLLATAIVVTTATAVVIAAAIVAAVVTAAEKTAFTAAAHW